MTRVARTQQGSTLIEMLVAMVVLAVIIIPLTTSIILGMTTNAATDQRVSDSSAAQLLSSFYVPDVQGAEQVLTSGFTCLPSGPQADGSTVTTYLEVHWTDPAPGGDVPKAAAYAVRVAGSPGEDPQLRRYSCSGGPLALVSGVGQVLLRSVSTVSAVCTATCLAGPNTPSSVALTVKASGSRASRGQTYYAPFTFTVSADRRVT